MKKTWWKEAVVYQIYPRSFNDSNGDGFGDLPGIIDKLDYIKSLGVDVIWLCPVYKSPNDDNGYDISDYYAIHEDFGSMEDLDRLLSGIHQRGMKLIMDLVVNHTSDEHAWFEKSKSSEENDKRAYYIWRKGKNDGPPNNWQSFFGGDAWAYDETTDAYYLHLFTKKQPDLNWENPRVRDEVYSMMKFWLDKGIDGFRMDVISLISKRNYEDTPFENFNDTIEKTYANGPKIHDYLKEMNTEVLSQYDMMTVGEGPGIDLKHGKKYISEAEQELNMIFHFDHMFIDHGPEGKFDPKAFTLQEFKAIFNRWDQELKEDAWGSIFLGNHDFPRIVSRFGNDGMYRDQSAKLLALMMLCMRGTPYIFQGEEIGMTNVAFDDIDDYNDIETKNVYRKWKDEGKDLDQLMRAIHQQGRDNARTPMQWENEKHGGFTDGEPWIKLNPNFERINVKSQLSDAHSILNFYRELIKCRKNHSTLVYGNYECIDPNHPSIFAFKRWDEEHAYLVVLNFSDHNQTFTSETTFSYQEMEILADNYNDFNPSDAIFSLKPWQGVLCHAKI